MHRPDCLILPVSSRSQRHQWGETQQVRFDDGSQLQRAAAHYRPPVEAYRQTGGEMSVADPERAARLLALGEIAATHPEQVRHLADFLGESVIPTQYVM